MKNNIQDSYSLINTCHFNMGKKKNKVAFVFSCPGQNEEKAQKPVAGQTGKNLDALLVYLNKKNSTIFRDTDRYEYRITNAWDKVEFESRTGRSEATQKEIKEEENLLRIENELKGMNTLILFGDRAQYIESLLNFTGKIIESRHLSLQSINQIEEDIHGTHLLKAQKGNTEKRLVVVTQDILAQLDKI